MRNKSFIYCIIFHVLCLSFVNAQTVKKSIEPSQDIICESTDEAFVRPGAVWYYKIQAFGGNGYKKLEYTGDTTINGYNCQKLRHTAHWAASDGVNPVYNHHDYKYEAICLHTQDNVVYYFADSVFFTLYDFNATDSAEWVIAINQQKDTGCDTFKVRVKETGFDTINDYVHQSFYIDPVPENSLTIWGNVINHIGAIDDFLIPTDFICMEEDVAYDRAVYSLRCYHDEVIGQVKFDDVECDKERYLYVENPVSYPLHIWPNPANNYFVIHAKYNQNIGIEIYNSTGFCMFTNGFQSNTSKHTIDCSTWQTGLYFIRLLKPNYHGKETIRKILVVH